jgi:hypothetical protein
MAKTETMIELKPIKIGQFKIELEGLTPLIVHAWSEKAKKEILDKQMKKAKAGREARDPVRDFIDSLYWLTPKPAEITEEGFESALKAGARFGFPSVAFKAAALSGGYRAKMIPNKVSAAGAFHIDAEFAELQGVPAMREDMVKLGGPARVSDIRFRAEFREWSTSLLIKYNESEISPEQIVNLFQIGGFAVGVGEWRLEKNGQYGSFQVKV